MPRRAGQPKRSVLGTDRVSPSPCPLSVYCRLYAANGFQTAESVRSAGHYPPRTAGRPAQPRTGREARGTPRPDKRLQGVARPIGSYERDTVCIRHIQQVTVRRPRRPARGDVRRRMTVRPRPYVWMDIKKLPAGVKALPRAGCRYPQHKCLPLPGATAIPVGPRSLAPPRTRPCQTRVNSNAPPCAENFCTRALPCSTM